jgi:hypothetical protein
MTHAAVYIKTWLYSITYSNMEYHSMSSNTTKKYKVNFAPKLATKTQRGSRI